MALQEWRYSTSKVKASGMVGVALFIQFYLFHFLPFFEWKINSDLAVYLARTCSVAISLLMIWAFSPRALQRFPIRITWKNLGYFVAGCGFTILITVVRNGDPHASIFAWANALLFTLFIGLDEETFDRGLIFGILERFGREIALALSAVIFGASHITNFLYGEDSFNYSLGHMVDAAGFGYLMGAIMLATGNIWWPIFLHGMVDLSWVIMDPKESLAITSGNSNWLMIFVYFAVNIMVARMLLSSSDGFRKGPKIIRFMAKKLGLVE